MKAIRDDVDQQLLPLFLEEAGELFPQIGNLLKAWREQSGDEQVKRKLQRNLHTLKGSARMAGAMRIGELVHRLEDRIAAAWPKRESLFWKDLQNEFAHIGSIIDQLHGSLAAPMAAAGPGVAAENVGEQAVLVVPFSSISERLYRVVRQTCKEVRKRANLELHGTEMELDRRVLEKLTAPFEHLLRNAIAHGLESPGQRDHAGKPPIGDIRLSLCRESNDVIFEFSDDGVGLDLVRLYDEAVGLGLLQPGEEVGDPKIMQMIFTPGLSTAAKVTEISGRGVGMDVVHNEIASLGGSIEVFSQQGKGTYFIIRLPLTLE